MMRGFFGVGVESISKEANAGAIMRTANAFGASYMFTVGSPLHLSNLTWTDTSKTFLHCPLFQYDHFSDITFPEKTTLVGVELTDESVNLPSFKHPLQAVYMFGPEMGSLSPEIQQQCDFMVKIPTQYCVNVSVAAALIMYDRAMSYGDYAPRPTSTLKNHELPKPNDFIANQNRGNTK